MHLASFFLCISIPDFAVCGHKSTFYLFSVYFWQKQCVLLMTFMFCSSAYTGCKVLWLEMCYTNKFYLLLQLLTKNSAHRLGCVASEGGESAIISHPFFNGIDWEKLNRRELEPPFKPRIVSPSERF